MSILREIAQKVKELLDDLETLEKEKIVTFEYPFEDKEEYFCLHIDGEIIQNLWSGGPFDEGVYKQGHVFKNREEARKERDKREILMRFNQFRDKCNGDWKPDWSTHLDNKYHIYKAHGHEQLLISEDLYCTSFVAFGYFHKYADAERAIELFGDEIIRLWVDE
nr:MAG TPA: hypothetical protein [Caudoviricetes sp.]